MNNAPHTPARTVAITGGARGIGYQTAKELIRRGHRVAIGDIDEARAKEAAAELGVKVVTRLDVTEPDSFTTFLDLVERELGPLDILINNDGHHAYRPRPRRGRCSNPASSRDQCPGGHLRDQTGSSAHAAAPHRTHHQHCVIGRRARGTWFGDLLRYQVRSHRIHRGRTTGVSQVRGSTVPQSARRSPTPNSSPEPPAQRDYATPSRRRSPARQQI